MPRDFIRLTCSEEKNRHFRHLNIMSEENKMSDSVLPLVSNQTLTAIGRPILTEADVAEFQYLGGSETLVLVLISPVEELKIKGYLRAIAGKFPAFRTKFTPGTVSSKQEIARSQGDARYHKVSVPGAVAVDYTGSLIFDSFQVNPQGLVFCRRYADPTVREHVSNLLHPSFVEETTHVSIGCLETMPDSKHLEELKDYLKELSWVLPFPLTSLKKLENRNWFSLFIKKGNLCWVPAYLEPTVEYMEMVTPDPNMTIANRMRAAEQVVQLRHHNFERNDQSGPPPKPHQTRDQKKNNKKGKKGETPKRYVPPEPGMVGARMKEALPLLTNEDLQKREQSGVPLTNRFQTLGLDSDGGGPSPGTGDQGPQPVTSTPRDPLVKEVIKSQAGDARKSRRDSHVLDPDLRNCVDPNSSNNAKLDRSKSRTKGIVVDTEAVTKKLVKMANGDVTPLRPGTSFPGKRALGDTKTVAAASSLSSPAKKKNAKPLYPTDQLVNTDEHKEILGFMDASDVSEEESEELFRTAFSDSKDWENSTMRAQPLVQDVSSESNPSRSNTPLQDERPLGEGRDERIEELMDKSLADEAMVCVRSGPGLTESDSILVDAQTINPLVAQQVVIAEGRPLEAKEYVPGLGQESLPLNVMITPKFSKKELTTAAAASLLDKLDSEILAKTNMKQQLLRKFPMSAKSMVDETSTVRFKEGNSSDVKKVERQLDKILSQKNRELKVIKQQRQKFKNGGKGILREFRDLLDWDMDSQVSMNDYESILSADLDLEDQINQQSDLAPPASFIAVNHQAEDKMRRSSGNFLDGELGDPEGRREREEPDIAGPSQEPPGL